MNYSSYKKPVLLVGNGVRAAGAAELVIDFALKTNIPVLTTMNAVDLAQDDLRIGMIGTYGNRWSNMILAFAASGPRTMQAVASASASAAVGATTVALSSPCSTG